MIEVKEITINGKSGYDLVVYDDNVTVADYLDAVNRFIETAQIGRQRHHALENSSQCMACHNCCQERIPLTSIDLYNLTEHFRVDEVFEKYIHIAVRGRVVDITLKLGPDRVCRLNGPDSKLCTIYKLRPFVCQTYICCNLSTRARAVREAVLNTGEDQLVRDWLCLVENGVIEPKIDEAEDMELWEEDWEPTPFEGKRSYSEVLLKDICSPNLWGKLKGVR